MRTVLLNCGPIVNFDSDMPVVGSDMSNDRWITTSGKAIIIENNVIVKIMNSSEAKDDFESHAHESTKLIDLNGDAVIPGLIDSHTHLVWGGDRSKEVRLKQLGYTYSEIAAKGGGINYTVRMTREMTEQQLFRLAKRRALTAMQNGTTHLETKSGYGLDTASELKLLRVASMLNQDDSVPRIDSTWLGAHSIPDGMSLEFYTHELITNQLPKIVESGLARSADVFCEPGWFGVEESRTILKESRNMGLDCRMHIDEFCDGGGGLLAAELGVESADHAHYTSIEARESMKRASVNTGFLPGTPYALGTDWPDIKSVIDMEAPWTIATDFNPNNQVLSLPFAASCIVQRCGIDPLAALAACTINASFITPNQSNLKHGTITEGAVANLNILHTENWESWCLTPGHSPFRATMLEGKLTSHEL